MVIDSQPSPPEPCPPPLAWPDVLSAFHTDSDRWELENESRTLTGRTWGTGQPLYMLNGFAATSEMLALAVYLLRDQFRCVVFDSVIEASRDSKRLTIDDYVSDLILTADHHSDSQFSVFGASFGAAVALKASLDFPARIPRMILQHGFAYRPLSLFERTMARLYRRSRKNLSAIPGRMRVQFLNHRRWFPPFDGTRFEYLLQATGEIPLRDLSSKALAMDSFDIRNSLNHVSSPCLLIRTEGEGLIEAKCHDVLSAGLQDVRSEWLHSSGLHPSLTHPHRLAKLIKSFVSGPTTT